MNKQPESEVPEIQEPRKPSETNKTLLLIATSTPLLAMMYLQDVNIWVVFMLLTITISQAFNLSTIRMQGNTSDIISGKTYQVIDTINKIIQDYNGMYQNQVVLKDKNDTLIKSNKALVTAMEVMDKNMQELETKFEILNSNSKCVPPAI